MKQNYSVALCDILGFTSYVQSADLSTIVEHSLSWFAKALHHSIHKTDFPDSAPTLAELQNHTDLGLLWFSDTVLLYTREDSDKALQSLLSSVAWLLFETVWTTKLRLRCGISYGEAYIDPANSIAVGQPIIDAYLLEEAQAWSGGALTPQAVQRLPERVRSARFADWPVVPYAVPLRDNAVSETLAINWTFGGHDQTNLDWTQSRREPFPHEWIEKPRICEKWYNTKRFHDVTCRCAAPYGSKETE